MARPNSRVAIKRPRDMDDDQVSLISLLDDEDDDEDYVDESNEDDGSTDDGSDEEEEESVDGDFDDDEEHKESTVHEMEEEEEEDEELPVPPSSEGRAGAGGPGYSYMQDDEAMKPEPGFEYLKMTEEDKAKYKKRLLEDIRVLEDNLIVSKALYQAKLRADEYASIERDIRVAIERKTREIARLAASGNVRPAPGTKDALVKKVNKAAEELQLKDAAHNRYRNLKKFSNDRPYSAKERALVAAEDAQVLEYFKRKRRTMPADSFDKPQQMPKIKRPGESDADFEARKKEIGEHNAMVKRLQVMKRDELANNEPATDEQIEQMEEDMGIMQSKYAEMLQLEAQQILEDVRQDIAEHEEALRQATEEGDDEVIEYERGELSALRKDESDAMEELGKVPEAAANLSDLVYQQVQKMIYSHQLKVARESLGGVAITKAELFEMSRINTPDRAVKAKEIYDLLALESSLEKWYHQCNVFLISPSNGFDTVGTGFKLYATKLRDLLGIRAKLNAQYERFDADGPVMGGGRLNGATNIDVVLQNKVVELFNSEDDGGSAVISCPILEKSLVRVEQFYSAQCAAVDDEANAFYDPDNKKSFYFPLVRTYSKYFNVPEVPAPAQDIFKDAFIKALFSSLQKEDTLDIHGVVWGAWQAITSGHEPVGPQADFLDHMEMHYYIMAAHVLVFANTPNEDLPVQSRYSFTDDSVLAGLPDDLKADASIKQALKEEDPTVEEDLRRAKKGK